jgi:predicted SnoaL-like aldol condensation-catalyzing enzyme
MNNSNKQLILDFYSRVFGQADIVFADSVIADYYIQHNPMVKTGKAGFMEFMAFLKHVPKPQNQQTPFKRLIHDHNFVAVHSQIEFMGKENATIDLYRIEDGIIAEHWDAVQQIVDSRPIVTGSTEIDDSESTNKNKQIIDDFVTQVLVDRQFGKSIEFLSNDLTLDNLETRFEHFKLHRIIGERNFVLTQSEAIIAAVSYVIYTVYRLSKGKIVEYWSVKQAVPQQMAHSNGMI